MPKVSKRTEKLERRCSGLLRLGNSKPHYALIGGQWVFYHDRSHGSFYAACNKLNTQRNSKGDV